MPGKNLVLKLYNLRTRFFPGMQFSQYARKQLSGNDISVFFNHQYFINRLVSDSGVWNLDRHE